MKKGDTVRCIEAVGPLALDQRYTVKRTFIGNQRKDEATVPGMEKTPGVELVELPHNYFVRTRFEVIQ